MFPINPYRVPRPQQSAVKLYARSAPLQQLKRSAGDRLVFIDKQTQADEQQANYRQLER